MDLSRDQIMEDLFAVDTDRRKVIWLFLRLLGVITFLAFLSFHLQLPGLIGDDGIMPAEERIDMVRGDGTPDIIQFPSLLTIIGGKGLPIVTLGGMAVSLLLILNIAPTLAVILLWFLHMSIVAAGGPFTEHQTDILLTETLFVAIFLTPRRLLPGSQAPSQLAVDAMKIVLVKLILFSGVMKLAGSPTWQDLTALGHHLLTQPLPTPLAWYGTKLPGLVLQAGTLLVLLIELTAPLLVVRERRYRLPAVASIAAIQVGIMAMGSFGLLNVLTLLLCLPVLTDTDLGRVRGWIEDHIPAREARPPGRLTVAGTLIYLGLSLLVVPIAVGPHSAVPEPIIDVVEGIDRTHSINRLGVYAHLPTQRKELRIEGRWNGSWEQYRYQVRPNSASDPPPMPQFLVPRLDLWMTREVDRDDRSVWFALLLRRLLAGSETTGSLFAEVPYPRPPEAIRAISETYRFSTWEERKADRTWWERQDREILLTVNRTGNR